MYEPFSIWEKNNSLRISFSSYSQPWILSSSELTSPFLMILPGSNSHLSKFPFRHLWQEQIFSFRIIRPSEKKAVMCSFSHCKIFNSPLVVFLFLPDDLQKQLCTPSLVYQGVSALNALSPVLHHWKKTFCDDTFSERSFYPKTAHRINQPFTVSWNTIIQNYSLIVLFS